MAGDFEELAARVEAADGPDRELDCLIWCALSGVTNITYPTEGHPMTPGRSGRVEATNPDGTFRLLGWIDPGKVQRNWTSYGGEGAYPHVTGSLDAAMTLVPEGHEFGLVTYGDDRSPGKVFANVCTSMKDEGGTIGTGATPALALASAALKARARANGAS